MKTLSSTQRKVIIIGSGIGGPALALFLKRAGIEAEIYEARETAEGYALSVSCNGVAVLQMLELDGAAFAEGSAVSDWSLWNSRGKRLGGGSFTSGGIKSVFIKRAPLGMILADEAERQGIRIQRGKKLQNIEVANTGGVTALFQDGTHTSGDLLIGCDGVHSRTRLYVDPTTHPAYSGLINSGGYSQGVDLPTKPETLNFVFCKRAFFGYHVSPTGYVYWFVNYPQAEEPRREALLRGADDEGRERLLDLFRDDPPFIRETIQTAESIFPEFLSYTLPAQPTSWRKGPVALLGDAAHAISPSSGQGASMALEDAAALAKCLRDTPDTEQALETYEQLRRERTTKMFQLGERGDSGKFVTRPLNQWFRDLTTPIFLKLFANPKASAWIYDYRVDWDARVAADIAVEGEKVVS